MVSSCTSYLWLKAKNLQVWFRNQIIWKYRKFWYPEIWTLCIVAFHHFSNATICENLNMHRPTLSARLGLVGELQQCTPQSQNQPQTPWPHLQPLQIKSAMEMILQNTDFFRFWEFCLFSDDGFYSFGLGWRHFCSCAIQYQQTWRGEFLWRSACSPKMLWTDIIHKQFVRLSALPGFGRCYILST